MYGWFEPTSEMGMSLFTLLTGRLLDAVANKEWVTVR